MGHQTNIRLGSSSTARVTSEAQSAGAQRAERSWFLSARVRTLASGAELQTFQDRCGAGRQTGVMPSPPARAPSSPSITPGHTPAAITPPCRLQHLRLVPPARARAPSSPSITPGHTPAAITLASSSSGGWSGACTWTDEHGQRCSEGRLGLLCPLCALVTRVPLHARGGRGVSALSYQVCRPDSPCHHVAWLSRGGG
jgi:hypothetical protein